MTLSSIDATQEVNLLQAKIITKNKIIKLMIKYYTKFNLEHDVQRLHFGIQNIFGPLYKF